MTTRKKDRLLHLPEISEITTLGEPTLRFQRHNGTGPPMFKMGRRLVCWESDLYAWMKEKAAEDGVLSAPANEVSDEDSSALRILELERENAQLRAERDALLRDRARAAKILNGGVS